MKAILQSMKDVIMDKKMIAVVIYIIIAVFSIITNINGKIEVQVDKEVSEAVGEVTAPAFKEILDRLDNQDIVLAGIEKRMNDNEVEKIVTNITKQCKKIDDENWGDIHETDINAAISGFARLEAQGYDPGLMAMLHPKIQKIRDYSSGIIGPAP